MKKVVMVLDEQERDLIESMGAKLLRLRGGRYTHDRRGEDDDFCFECGHIAPKFTFEMNDRCPNPDCPHPEFWDD